MNAKKKVYLYVMISALFMAAAIAGTIFWGNEILGALSDSSGNQIKQSNNWTVAMIETNGNVMLATNGIWAGDGNIYVAQSGADYSTNMVFTRIYNASDTNDATEYVDLAPSPVQVIFSGGAFPPNEYLFTNSATDGTDWRIMSGTGRVHGVVSYAGAQTGDLVLGVYTNPLCEGVPEKIVDLAGIGAYSVDVDPGTYYLYATIVTDPAGDLDNVGYTDPWGKHDSYATPQAVVVGASQVVTSVNIPLVDGVLTNQNPYASRIEGTVSYGGASAGTVYVAAFTNASYEGSPVSVSELSAPGAYSLTNIPSGTYYLGAMISTVSNVNIVKITDPWGKYDAWNSVSQVVVAATQKTENIDFALIDGSATNKNPFATSMANNDYNGDGVSDLSVYDPVAGQWFIRTMDGQVLAWFLDWGYPGAYPVPGDYNGDGETDLSVFDPIAGQWFIATTNGEVLAWFLDWGYLGSGAVSGDYNGDGISDLAVFDAIAGQWFIRTMDGEVLAWFLDWGYQGAGAVPGDYNGDGTDDLAVYDPVAGQWFIRTLDGEVLAWFLDWGYPGAYPVSGDYDGDGIDDLAVFDPIEGQWFIRTMDGTVLAWFLDWGYQGAGAVSGDYNGDGISDLSVFDPVLGQWFIRTLDGDVLAWFLDWGYPGAYPSGQDQ